MIKWINKKRNKKGFTLVELVVVIAILGILATLAVPKLTKTRETAQTTVDKVTLKTIQSAWNIYQAEGKGGWPGEYLEGATVVEGSGIKVGEDSFYMDDNGWHAE